ncbi:hypothetical protein L0U88_16570 [Flavihumibacter sp. RY-1]|uniref:Uncharacterized protein n=1 Tax=Flavihumibacter fluminis TaxID=2909236 RepID=A0ABS9BMP5_9BACT|nr:hypothetical protein [Flavihumibacter fluminis]MCF1716258.1 hypothetical protein [Flavihumibacter fluminis]
MTPDQNIENELWELAPALIGKQSLHSYDVPVGFFEQFPQRMLQLVKQDEAKEEIEVISPLLAGLSKKMPFTVPEGYFELSPASPLNTIGTEIPYTVPAGYFEELPQRMLSKVQAGNNIGNATHTAPSSSGAKVISLGRSWIRYAAAAVVTAVIALAGWLYFRPASDSLGVNPAFVKQLDKEIREISDEEILEFTNPTSTIYYGTAVLTPGELSGSEVHDLLGDVSDEALQQYLQEFNGKNANSMN